MDTEKLPEPMIQTGIQPNIQPGSIPPMPPNTIPPVTSDKVHKPKSNMLIFVGLFLLIIVGGGLAGFFLFPREGLKISSTAVATPTIPPSPTVIPSPTPVLCSDPTCLMPQFFACAPSEMTMPFVEGNFYVIKVFGKVNGLCHYSLTVLDKNGNIPLNSVDCQVPLEKITKDSFGHLFGEDKTPGKESIKAEQDKLESDYCVKKTAVLSPTAVQSPSLQVSPTPKKVACASDDPNCIFTNIIDGFTNGCVPVEVTTTVETAQQVTLTISNGENGACRFQMKGLGVDQNCLFAKENVKTEVIKGMLGMDNIPKDPEFIKIKAASCK